MPRGVKGSSGKYELRKRNSVSLRDDEHLDENLKIIKIGGLNTPLSLSKNEFRVDSNISINGIFKTNLIYADQEYLDLKSVNYLRIYNDTTTSGAEYKIRTASGGDVMHETYADFNVNCGEDIFLDATDDVLIRAAGGNIEFDDGSQVVMDFNVADCEFTIKNDADINDYFNIAVGAEGATTILTVDANTAVAHLTLAPDGDLVLDPVSQKVIINATDGLYFDGGTHTYITESSSDTLDIYAGNLQAMRIKKDSTSAVNFGSNYHVAIYAGQKLFFDTNYAGHTYMHESADDILDFYVGTDNMLKLDEANDRITLEASKLAYKIGSGGDEFSVADSAYAGMILGYRMIGEDGSRQTYTLTTSFVVPADTLTVRFIAPPSGAVEIMVQIKVDAQSGNTTFIGLSTANATSGYSTAGATYEQAINLIDETDNGTVQHYWVVTGLTAGDTYNYWVGFKKQSSGIGNGYLNWGGGSGEHCDFIMKATALPTAVSDFAEYD